MNLEERISEVLGGIGLREIAVEPAAESLDGSQFRVTCTAPLENGRISDAVEVEKLTWMTLPGGRELRIRELEVVDRTDETLRLGMDLSASRPERPPRAVAE